MVFQDGCERPTPRGHSNGVLGWNTGAKVVVEFNDKFQPVGPNAKHLKSQLGILVRDGQRLPLTMLDWTSFGQDVMDGIWEEVKVFSFSFLLCHFYNMDDVLSPLDFLFQHVLTLT